MAAWGLVLTVGGAHEASTGPALRPQDQGVFTLYLHGTRIGEERFVVRSEDDGTSEPLMIGVAELTMKLDGQTMRIRVALEAAGATPRPRRYEAEINGSELTRIVGTFPSDRAVLNVNSPAGEEMRQFLVRGKTAILDRHIAHHYYFASLQLGDQQSTEISVIVPRDRAQHTFIIEDRGIDSLTIEEGQLSVRHLAMTDEEGVVHHIWLDGEHLVRIEVPAVGFSAQRTDNLYSTPQAQGGL